MRLSIGLGSEELSQQERQTSYRLLRQSFCAERHGGVEARHDFAVDGAALSTTGIASPTVTAGPAAYAGLANRIWTRRWCAWLSRRVRMCRRMTA